VFEIFWIPAFAGMTIHGEPTGIIGSMLSILFIHEKDEVNMRAFPQTLPIRISPPVSPSFGQTGLALSQAGA